MPGGHEHLKLDAPITVSQKGYIYIWVSNQSEATRLWFDDLTVKISGSFVTKSTDYGVWGDVLREQKFDERQYRFGYQGQFSERDLETGLNSFQLRSYDPIIARWTSTDPYGQYYSPYLGMGNNPVSGVDPDGGYSKAGAWWRSAFGLRGEIYQSGYTEDGSREVWGFNTSDGVSHFGSEDVGTFWNGSNDVYMGGFENSAPILDGPYISNLLANQSVQNSSGLSTSFLAETAFAGTVAVGKSGLSVLNRELAKQNLINNMLKKQLDARKAFTSFSAPKGLRFVGKYGGLGFTAYGIIDNVNQYRTHRISGGRAGVEITSNLIGAIPWYGIGTAWSIGWNIDGSYGPSKWYGHDDTKWFK